VKEISELQRAIEKAHRAFDALKDAADTARRDGINTRDPHEFLSPPKPAKPTSDTDPKEWLATCLEWLKLEERWLRTRERLAALEHEAFLANDYALRACQSEFGLLGVQSITNVLWNVEE
jgi:hypothetical protein